MYAYIQTHLFAYMEDTHTYKNITYYSSEREDIIIKNFRVIYKYRNMDNILTYNHMYQRDVNLEQSDRTLHTCFLYLLLIADSKIAQTKQQYISLFFIFINP